MFLEGNTFLFLPFIEFRLILEYEKCIINDMIPLISPLFIDVMGCDKIGNKNSCI